MNDSIVKRNISVEFVNKEAVADQEIEIVERKGLGHPDSLCDGIADAVSVALCKEYERRCGIILHHNTDKVQLIAGRSCPDYGGGEVISPICILLGGRATGDYGGEEIAVDTVAIKAAKEYLKKAVRNLEVESQVVVESRLGKGSSDLLTVFGNDKKSVPVANDTSFGVAHAPFSETESIAFNAEKKVMAEYLNKAEAIGEDMKVMALRVKSNISLTVGDAFVSRYVDDYEHYGEVKRNLKEFVSGVAETYTDKKVTTHVNLGDSPESVYITVTGTSAEMGDDGATGRGNRCSGLITPNRPISMEAAAGKNPVNHTGKIYNLLANEIAKEVADTVEGVREVDIKLLSQIGRRIDDPAVASAQIITNSDVNNAAVEKKVERIIDDWLANVTVITDMVSRGELKTF